MNSLTKARGGLVLRFSFGSRGDDRCGWAAVKGYYRLIDQPDDSQVSAQAILALKAQDCLSWYCLRWRIEDWHRVLKSGCRIEDLAHHSAERLERAIAINLVIAWRIMLMTLLGRACPALPAQVLLSDIEVTVLSAFAKQNRITPPANLGDAVRLVA